jgi:16S rRNA G966 N2-methylase RsmD
MDEKAVALAKRNLQLLGVEGIDRRISEISNMFELYNKDSHKDALTSAAILKHKISDLTPEYQFVTRVFQANATDRETIAQNIKPNSVDIVFTDVPYGQHSHWQDTHADPLWSLLNSLIGVLSTASIVAIVSDKGQKGLHENFQRVEQFQVGKRRITLLKPI